MGSTTHTNAAPELASTARPSIADWALAIWRALKSAPVPKAALTTVSLATTQPSSLVGTSQQTAGQGSSKPVAALTRLLDNVDGSRVRFRHLHILEQTLMLKRGNVELVPEATLDKASRQVHQLIDALQVDRGANPSFSELLGMIDHQLVVIELRRYVDARRSTINWQAPGASSEDAGSDSEELRFSAFVDTERMRADEQACAIRCTSNPVGWAQ